MSWIEEMQWDPQSKAICALVLAITIGCANVQPPNSAVASVNLDALGFAEAKANLTVTEQTAARLAVAKWFAVHIPTKISFANGRSQLSADARRALTQQADFMKLFPEIGFYIYGHADTRELGDATVALSAARARAVHDFLIASGVPAAQLQGQIARGSADVSPALASDAGNRRVVTELASFLVTDVPSRDDLMMRVSAPNSP